MALRTVRRPPLLGVALGTVRRPTHAFRSATLSAVRRPTLTDPGKPLVKGPYETFRRLTERGACDAACACSLAVGVAIERETSESQIFQWRIWE